MNDHQPFDLNDLSNPANPININLRMIQEENLRRMEERGELPGVPPIVALMLSGGTIIIAGVFLLWALR